MIKAVIFDVGGVLVRTEDRSHRRALEKQFGLAVGGSEELVFNSEMGQKAQCGDITEEALWNWLRMELRLSSEGIADFRKRFWAGDVLDHGLVAMIRNLKMRYRTAIISNATDALEESLTEQFAIGDAFDIIVGSATEGITKPDPKIYLTTLERLRLEPAETVFIDDFVQNVAAARKLGMHAILFHPGIDVVAELAGLGVTV